MRIAWPILQNQLSTTAPRHWCEARVGDVAELINGYPFDSNLFASEGTYPLVRIRDLGDGPLDTWITGDVPASVLLREGDIVVGMDGDFNVAWWNKGPAALNQRLCLLRGRQDRVDQRFLFYALPRTLKVINELTYFTTVKHLASGDLLSERLFLPPVEEQRTIADYLDRETSRIDSLTDELVSLASLVAVRRAAEIDNAIEHGGGDMPLVPVESPWIDAVPKGWRFLPLKRCAAKITVGIVINPSQYYEESGVPVLRGFNVRPALVSDTDVAYMSEESNELNSKSRLEEGDVVVVRTGAAGAAAQIPLWAVGGNIVDLLLVRPGLQLRPKFLEFVLNSRLVQRQVAVGSVGALQSHFNTGALANVWVVVPDLDEQDRLLAHLSIQIGRYDSLIESLGNLMLLLSEHRQALITAAVAGGLGAVGRAA